MANAQAAAADPRENPMYGVALLKIAMELKKDPSRTFEQILGGVVDAMGFEPSDFQRYVAQNMGLLVTTAKARGY